jgi:hypothetical protein
MAFTRSLMRNGLLVPRSVHLAGEVPQLPGETHHPTYKWDDRTN